MKKAALAAVCLCALAGCTLNLNNGSDEDDSGSFNPGSSNDGSSIGNRGSTTRSPDATSVESALGQLSDCEPAEPSFRLAHEVYMQTRQSVHELVTCGQMQVDTAFKMRLLIIASNEEQFDEQTYADLQEAASFIGLDLELGFEHDGEGTWSMAVDAGDDSTFDLRFYDPASGDVLRDSVFELDNYLVGVDADNELSLQEMIADPFRKNTFTYSFEEPGPLGHLMNGGEEIPNPFEVRLSLFDAAFGTGGEGDFGPFDSVLDVEMDSLVSVSDPRGEVTVTYDVRANRDSARSVATASLLDFEVESIAAGDGEYLIETDAAEISFVGRGSLAGTIDYRLSGPDVDVRVTSDFGQGASYPTPVWGCAE